MGNCQINLHKEWRDKTNIQEGTGHEGGDCAQLGEGIVLRTCPVCRVLLVWRWQAKQYTSIKGNLPCKLGPVRVGEGETEEVGRAASFEELGKEPHFLKL